MRLTSKNKFDDYYFINGTATCPNEIANKLGQLEDIEDELGVNLVEFLTECKYVLKNANHTIGYTSKGIKIETDFGYVNQFIDEMKKALTKKELKK